jgi:hypothetical protein
MRKGWLEPRNHSPLPGRQRTQGQLPCTRAGVPLISNSRYWRAGYAVTYRVIVATRKPYHVVVQPAQSLGF